MKIAGEPNSSREGVANLYFEAPFSLPFVEESQPLIKHFLPLVKAVLKQLFHHDTLYIWLLHSLATIQICRRFMPS